MTLRAIIYSTVFSIILLPLIFTAPVDAKEKPINTCLVLQDGQSSEYAWCKFESEAAYATNEPGQLFFVRGLLDYPNRFQRWLNGFNVTRIDLERHEGALPLDGVDILIIDDVRQYILDSHESGIVEFLRRGGSLIVYAGSWGLGGAPKSALNVLKDHNDLQTPLAKILPVEMLSAPDLILKKESCGSPVFTDTTLGKGIDTSSWRIYGLHTCKARGEVLATLDGHPLISMSSLGKGRVIVYTADDLGWTWVGARSELFNRYSGTLWRRLVALAVNGKADGIAAVPDPSPSWEKPASFAHPDQPINFLWGGYFNFYGTELEKYWVKDVVTHSCNYNIDCIDHIVPALGDAGIMGTFLASRCVTLPNLTRSKVCANDPENMQKVLTAVSTKAAELKNQPLITHGHMGDEAEFDYCACDNCKNAFRREYGYELPEMKSGSSPDYLDKWIDYCHFHCRSVGSFYRRIAETAKKSNPHIKSMYASLLQGITVAYGDDQFHTQAGFDLVWNHCYPGTQTILTGMHASLSEETTFVQGRPYAPHYDLLQCFAYLGSAPPMPPKEYVRTMAWQAIAHGADSVGWFVYNDLLHMMPGSEAWDEIGRLGQEVLEPLTPTLYKMMNAEQPIGLMYCYSQESIDGLRSLSPADKNDPWNSLYRWRTFHATQEAYEAMKYAHLPINVVSEYRLLQNKALPWKVIVIPYVEHLHSSSRQALARYIADGGIVYVGAGSTFDLPGVKKLPCAFDAFMTTWFPRDRQQQWNQRRVRQYTITSSLQKAIQLRDVFAPICAQNTVTVTDPEVVYNVREAGEAKYIFVVNDHQINPTTSEMRQERGQYGHYILMPMEFPQAKTSVTIRGTGYLYPLLADKSSPVKITGSKPAVLNMTLDGGDGRVFLLLPQRISKLEFTNPPVRTDKGIRIQARIMGEKGLIKAALPLRIDFRCGDVHQTVYASTHDGVLDWTAPYLKEFPKTKIDVIVTDMASGLSVKHR